MRLQYDTGTGEITGADPAEDGVDFAVNLPVDYDFTDWTVTGTAPYRVLSDPGGQERAAEDAAGPETHSTLATLAADVEGGVPEVPATPAAQDVVDALVALGLVTQAA
jgi:hypothetical protein